MMIRMKDVVYYITAGLALAFTLIAYAHNNFSTKSSLNTLRAGQERREDIIIRRLDRIENKLDKVIYKEPVDGR